MRKAVHVTYIIQPKKGNGTFYSEVAAPKDQSVKLFTLEYISNLTQDLTIRHIKDNTMPKNAELIILNMIEIEVPDNE